MADMSANDRAIKRSAESEPEYVKRPSALALEDGELKDSILAQVSDQTPANYTHVKVIDYPSFHEAFSWYRVNFYYEHEEDPRTRINSFIVDKNDL